MRNDESATALAAEGLVAASPARTSSVDRVAVATAAPTPRAKSCKMLLKQKVDRTDCNQLIT